MSDWSGWREAVSHRLRLVAPGTARHDFRRASCGPSSSASVDLAFEPAGSFSLVFACHWPPHLAAAETARMEAAIAAGVFDALGPVDGSPFDARCILATCTGVAWDDVGSSEMAFYAAAWHATQGFRQAADWELLPRKQQAAEQRDAADERPVANGSARTGARS